AAGVSRGAVYHHFPSRDDVIAAVYESEAAAAIARAADRMPEGATGYERLIAGCLAWLDEVSRPGARLILIEDGPAVLGWRRCRPDASPRRNRSRAPRPTLKPLFSVEDMTGQPCRTAHSAQRSPSTLPLLAGSSAGDLLLESG
ncbi:TetR/AcrR family transcriptional regulator, partial [Streptomyces cellostaticus]|uniref:TetR/AcrR family transcriptional regulator n=1 Tax=Streptomyces cellostaticus TaxID=67285 RepID=UPI0035A859D0